MSRFTFNVDNISYEINGKKILKNISFDVKPGEIIGVIGPNGSGKTTLLKSLNNINEISSGSITFDNKKIDEFSSKELAKHISFMNQNTNIGFDFPCIDVVVLGRYPYLDAFSEYSKKDIEIAEKFMKLTNTLKFRDKSILSLSGGERQRVLFAKTLTQDTDIILLDEPTASLDMKYEEDIFKILKDIKEDNKGVVAIIHNLRTAIKYCDRLLLLNEGKVVQIGKPSEIITEENLRNVYKVDVCVYENKINGKLDFCIL
ncbi:MULTISPECIES: ABC transporter ATP-binding protein [Fusobacterium]|jgi:iron complex transport system ATP-binding protein|uniref:ABC transporter ATP-binding protein n=1 Tax=Fusobacterium hominis TaxID=2764326 RepID=A0A7G9GUG1_9FUSO|nr:MULTISPECIES: ABC transporter ATP-binding protein [Fusobacterium]QNM14443.1 ABC transporter ATP-binding protein [Fusobacterium hominis]